MVNKLQIVKNKSFLQAEVIDFWKIFLPHVMVESKVQLQFRVESFQMRKIWLVNWSLSQAMEWILRVEFSRVKR